MAVETAIHNSEADCNVSSNSNSICHRRCHQCWQFCWGYLPKKALIESLPENEDKEYEEGKEDGDIVNGAQHDDQLATESGHKADQLENAQQAKGAQDGEATAMLFQKFQQTEEDDAAVEDIETTLYVLEKTVSEELKDHLAAEDCWKN